MPIAMSTAEWSRIVRWTDADKEDPDAVRRREYVKKLDTASQAMTKSWPNSVENVNKRNEEIRRARIDAAEQANTKFYKRYVKRQKEEQQRLMYSARDMVFKNKDAPKLLLSAVIETVIQKERIIQKEFNEERRRAEAEQKRRDDDDVIRRAKEWNELVELKKKRRFEANKAHQKELLDQAHEISERNRKEHEAELRLQQLDNLKATEQINAIKEFDADFKAAEKARIWADMEQARREGSARRREQAAREQMDARLTLVLNRARARIERKRKQTEADIKNEKLRVLEAISQKLESGDAAREAKDQAILDKAIKEKEAIEAARRAAQERKEEQFKRERVQAREQFLRDEAQRLHEFNTTRQWEIMNRFKNQELYEEFQEKLRLEKERKTKEYRADIIKLWQERLDAEARSLAETRHFYGALALSKLRQADNRLLAHAAALLDEARRHQRPPHALHKALHRYCALYRLYPMPELPASLREHFGRYAPCDGSQPDAGYAEPPPPPPDRGPDAPDEPDAPALGPAVPGLGPDAPNLGPDAPNLGPNDNWAEKRDGLQPITQQVGPSLSVREESVSDYKRMGRANGLQRRRAQHDLTLPPITVPCKTEDCTCELKRGQ